jgi:hypothetical protein
LHCESQRDSIFQPSPVLRGQGCAARATLGQCPKTFIDPEGLPFQGLDSFLIGNQGGAALAVGWLVLGFWPFAFGQQARQETLTSNSQIANRK